MTGLSDPGDADRSVADLSLSTRARNVLAAEGLTTVEQVRAFGYENVYRLRNAGRIIAGEIWLAIGESPAPLPDGHELGRARGLAEAASWLEEEAERLMRLGADASAYGWAKQAAKYLRSRANVVCRG